MSNEDLDTIALEAHKEAEEIIIAYIDQRMKEAAQKGMDRLFLALTHQRNWHLKKLNKRLFGLNTG